MKRTTNEKAGATNTGFPEKTLTTNAVDSKPFVGTSNPRELRAIHALLGRSIFRFELDDVIGTTNAPHVVMRLRGKGLKLPCELVAQIDQDGRVIHPGRYSFTWQDRAALHAWMTRCGQSL